jgi:hypothetical protein
MKRSHADETPSLGMTADVDSVADLRAQGRRLGGTGPKIAPLS